MPWRQACKYDLSADDIRAALRFVAEFAQVLLRFKPGPRRRFFDRTSQPVEIGVALVVEQRSRVW
jgi:hypothetical protein